MATKAHLDGNRRWDAANYASKTLKIPKTLLADFAAACKAAGDSQNGVLREAMEAYIAKRKAGE